MKKQKRMKTVLTLVTLAVVLLVVVPVALALPFNDVPAGYWAFAAIDRISNLHITAGCGSGKFCPEQNVTRAQMAGFINNLTKAWTDQNEPYIMSVENKNNGSGQSGDGIIAKSYAGVGLKGESTNYIGVYGSSTTHWSGWFDNGIRISDSPWHGIQIDDANWAGVWVAHAGFAGVEANGTRGAGVLGVSVDADSVGKAGVHGYATGGWEYGVLGQDGSGTDMGDGLRTTAYNGAGSDARINDDLTVDGTCFGCAQAYMAVNEGADTLEPGDVVVVSGIGQVIPEMSGQRPLLTVRRMTEADHGTTLLAVVIEGSPPKHDSGIENNGTTPDFIPSGGYVAVATRGGLTRLKVEASAGAVQVGDTLTAAATAGYAAKAQPVTIEGVELYAPGSVIGRALESLAEGQGLIWVLVDMQ
jgi:hypothetical protein